MIKFIIDMKYIVAFLFLLVTQFTNAQILQRNPNGIGNKGFDDFGNSNPFPQNDTTYNEIADSTGQIIFENTDTINFITVVKKYNLDLIKSDPVISVDTVHKYQRVMQSDEPTRNLGNNGTSVYNLTYNPIFSSTIDMGLNTFSPYHTDVNDVNYYQAQRPFTKLYYVTGSERENDFSITHTQNWGRGLNVGANYRSLVSEGFYFNQAIDYKQVNAHSWYRSKDKKLNIMAQYINNKHLIGQNGGIDVTENVYQNPDFNQRQGINVAMNTAKNLFKGKNINLQTSYDFGQSFNVEINDSISDTELIPQFRVQHTFNYRDDLYNFKSDSLESRFFTDTYFPNTSTTKDTLDVQALTNEFRIKWLGNKLVDSTIVHQNFLADAYARISSYKIAMRDNYSDKPTDITVGGSFRSNPLDSAKIVYKTAGEYHITGYKSGDYSIRGEAGFNLNNIAGELVGFIELTNEEQPYTANHFYQTHYQFNNNLKKRNARTIGGNYHNPITRTWVNARYTNVTNQLWYNANRQPVIEGDAISYLLVNAKQHFKYGKFNAIANGYYQTSSNTQTIRVPTLITQGDVFYKGPLFKNNVFAKIGLNATFASKHNYDRYDPSLDQFYYQEKEYFNNPQVGFFTNFQLSRARVFLRLDNLQSFLEKEPNFQAYNYPQHDFAFRAGINWVFVN